MVDKKNSKKPNRSELVQQDTKLQTHVANLETLEKRIILFDEKLIQLYKEIQDMKSKQEELINIVKQGLR